MTDFPGRPTGEREYGLMEDEDEDEDMEEGDEK